MVPLPFFLNKSKHWLQDTWQVFPSVLLQRAQFMEMHTLQFCDHLFQGYQNHDKREIASKYNRNITRMAYKFSVSNCVSVAVLNQSLQIPTH
eukprot:bmy_03786T0